MPMKEQQRAVYRSARGKEVDMAKLALQNELTPAVGNMKVNARGDKLGAGGAIIAPAVTATIVPEQFAKKDVSNMDPEGNE